MSVFEAQLKSAESALTFVQNEHKKVLNGLHEEIKALQQKCAGKTVLFLLQFDRGINLTRYFCGTKTNPGTASLDKTTPGSFSTLNLCKMFVKNL